MEPENVERLCAEPAKNAAEIRNTAQKLGIPLQNATVQQLCALLRLPTQFSFYTSEVGSKVSALKEVSFTKVDDGCTSVTVMKATPDPRGPKRMTFAVRENTDILEAKEAVHFLEDILVPHLSAFDDFGSTLALNSYSEPADLDKLYRLTLLRFDGTPFISIPQQQQIEQLGPYLGKIAAWEYTEPIRQRFRAAVTEQLELLQQQVKEKERNLRYEPIRLRYYFKEGEPKPELQWKDRITGKEFLGKCPPTAAQLEHGIPKVPPPVAPTPPIPVAPQTTTKRRRRLSAGVQQLQSLFEQPQEPALKKQRQDILVHEPLLSAVYSYSTQVEERPISLVDLERAIDRLRAQQWTSAENIEELGNLLSAGADPTLVYYWKNIIQLESGGELLGGNRFGPYASRELALADARRYYEELESVERASLDQLLFPWINRVYDEACCADTEKSVRFQVITVSMPPPLEDYTEYVLRLGEQVQYPTTPLTSAQYLVVAMPWNEQLVADLTQQYADFLGGEQDSLEYRRAFIEAWAPFLVLRWNTLLTSMDGQPHLPVFVDSFYCNREESACWGVTVAVYAVDAKGQPQRYVDSLYEAKVQLEQSDPQKQFAESLGDRGLLKLTPLPGSEVKAEFEFSGLSQDEMKSAVRGLAGLLQHRSQLLSPTSTVTQSIGAFL